MHASDRVRSRLNLQEPERDNILRNRKSLSYSFRNYNLLRENWIKINFRLRTLLSIEEHALTIEQRV